MARWRVVQASSAWLLVGVSLTAACSGGEESAPAISATPTAPPLTAPLPPSPPDRLQEGPTPTPTAIAAALTPGVDASIDSLPSLDDEAAWHRVAVPSDEHAIARTEVVKVLFDRGRDALHFCQSERWPLHYDFVMHAHPEERERYPAMRDFMTRNYLRADRAYVLGSVVRYVEADLWALELGPADTLDASGVRQFLDEIAARAFFGPSLRFHPRSARQIEAAARAGLRTLDADERCATSRSPSARASGASTSSPERSIRRRSSATRSSSWPRRPAICRPSARW